MCEICRKSHCDARCPNAPEAVPDMRCIECNEGLYIGDKYFPSEKGPICEWCMREKTLSELLDLVGEELSIV